MNRVGHCVKQIITTPEPRDRVILLLLHALSLMG